jgi:endonuclease-3
MSKTETSQGERRKKVDACIRILEDLYGVPRVEEFDPVDLLVMTILSQNTSDTNSHRAFAKLKSGYPSYQELLGAPEKEIAEKIREGGLAEIKTQRIKATLHKIKEDTGSISLSFLADLGKEKAAEYLTSLPGVGPKTAAVVLLFAFRMPFMPVDTHVYRVTRRLGLVPEKASVKRAQEILEEITPPEKYLSLHLNLIIHGRSICRARNPRHDECALRSLCCFYQRAQALNERSNHPHSALR